MTDEKRATLAYLSGVLFNPGNRQYNSIFDYNRRMYVSLSCTRNGSYLSIYDYSRQAFLTGNMPSFYDYASSAYINLNKIDEYSISCFDYETATYANVRIIGQSISIYDYQTGNYYNYMIQ